MYSKCGSLISARALFDRISSRDLISWNTIIASSHELIKSMVIEPGIAVWVTLLSECLNHKRLELGQYIAEKVLNLNPDDLGVYSLVSINVYAAARNWEEVIEGASLRAAGNRIQGRGEQKEDDDEVEELIKNQLLQVLVLPTTDAASSPDYY